MASSPFPLHVKAIWRRSPPPGRLVVCGAGLPALLTPTPSPRSRPSDPGSCRCEGADGIGGHGRGKGVRNSRHHYSGELSFVNPGGARLCGQPAAKLTHSASAIDRHPPSGSGTVFDDSVPSSRETDCGSAVGCDSPTDRSRQVSRPLTCAAWPCLPHTSVTSMLGRIAWKMWCPSLRQ